MSLIFKYVYIV